MLTKMRNLDYTFQVWGEIPTSNSYINKNKEN
jgi:hypothetical protein